jgi:hypothetical protein
MQGHLKINVILFSALCPPQLHKIKKPEKQIFGDLENFQKIHFLGHFVIPSWKISVKIELLLVPPVGDIIKYICFQLV